MLILKIPQLLFLVIQSRFIMNKFIKNRKLYRTEIEQEKNRFSKTLLKILGINFNDNFLSFDKNFRLKKDMIIISNHRSFVDILLIQLVIDKLAFKQTMFVAKKELKENFLFGKLIEMFGVFFIERGNSKSTIKLFKDIKEYKENNTNIAYIIFPEGTRNKTDKKDVQSFEKGVEIIAKKNNLDILPFYISGYPESYFEKVNRRKQKIGIKVHIGSIIDNVSEIETEYQSFIKGKED